ncbi:CDP-alcohol phosphatidyltransferase family protein [Nocardioides dongxiaopingii]|uniref:CDP-alcohol phosphatidyltransferase family protein n=1 Tax=Nocardioides dongxiaopingii TaxID=2576036 RepID=UPI0010C7629D|nr:CDP-alcohol phosphatidyltransferase family protein [Nocardioides dongxiaopingii]
MAAPRREDALDQWSRRHGGLDPRGSGWVAGWVRLSDACARPLARRGVAPDAVTAAGVAVAVTVPLLASAGAAWPLAAVPVMVAAAVLDGVDGALASRTGTSSRWGQVLDPLADRVSDLLLVLTLVVLGAPLWLGATYGALGLLHESVRSTAQAAGMGGPGAVTVAERPTRVIVAAFAALLCGLEWCAREVGVDVLPRVDGDVVATGAAVVGTALAVVGLVHLLAVVRRRLA